LLLCSNGQSGMVGYLLYRTPGCLPSSGLIGRRPILVPTSPPPPFQHHVIQWVQRLATSFYPLFPTFITTARPTLHPVSYPDEHKSMFKNRKLLSNAILKLKTKLRGLSPRAYYTNGASILGFPDRSRYFFFQVAPQLYSRDWVDPVPDPLLLIKSDSAANRTRASGSATRNFDTRPQRRSKCNTCIFKNELDQYVPHHSIQPLQEQS
jgi:hypothetical protein